MEDQKEKVVVNIANYDGKDPIEVIIRNGEAASQPEPLATKAPESINVSGVISTPLDWLVKRVDTIDQLKANIQVNREKMMITLTVEERDAYLKSKIVGTVAVTETYEHFGINDSQTGWIPAKLGQFLRLNRGVFEDRQECMMLVSQLKNFTAKAKTEIQKQRDPSGSTADVYRQEVESNLPKSFTVNLAIFKGTAKQAIEVEFDHYLKDGEVFLQLVSPGANELAESYRDQCIDDVLNKIREVAPNIAILEV
ncbi:hypothetical protein IMSAG025_01886 [Muribaculaceae bacterium]|nr:hypothetical protein IMSAG025_01886 [Muribaculaceae bacterium]